MRPASVWRPDAARISRRTRLGKITTQLARNITVPTLDSLIAAIAVHHGLVLGTRNSADCRHFPSLALETPWQGGSAG